MATPHVWWTWSTSGDKIIDGRNRYRACIEAEEPPKFQHWNGQGTLVAFVGSLNLPRPHLNESQRTMVAAKIANMERGRPEENTPIGAISQEEAAAPLNVSVRSIQRGKKVLDEGSLKLVSKVEAESDRRTSPNSQKKQDRTS